MKHYTDTKYCSFHERFVHDTLSPVGLVWGFVYGSLLLALLIASSVSSMEPHHFMHVLLWSLSPNSTHYSVCYSDQ